MIGWNAGAGAGGRGRRPVVADSFTQRKNVTVNLSTPRRQ
jgi:hypothetical protein